MTDAARDVGGNADYRGLPVSRMEEIVNSFNARVDAAQAERPDNREWVARALRRQGGPRCPVRAKRTTTDLIVRHGDALADLYCEYPDDMVVITPYEWMIGFQPAGRKDRVNPVQALMKESQWVDEWGARWAHAANGVGAIQVDHPLKDMEALDEYLETRMPDPRGPGRLAQAEALMAPHRGRKHCMGMHVLGMLEQMRTIRDMQDLFMDFCANEAKVQRLMDALCAFNVGVLMGWAEIGADSVVFGDDWGMQTGLQISPEMWRDLFKPRYKAIFAEAHKAGLTIIFHSCGKVIDIVEDLIDVGVDVLDPLQPGCMDPVEVARRFGGRISFSGAIDLQGLMVFGTPSEVKKEVERLIAVLGAPFGNGFAVGPSNAMTPDIPLRNIRAMMEACHGR